MVLRNSELIDVYCHSNEDNYMMELLAKITKKALELKIVSYDELFLLNETQIFGMFEESNDKELKDNLKLFKNIKVSDIPKIEMPFIKNRDLNPIVGDCRLK